LVISVSDAAKGSSAASGEEAEGDGCSALGLEAAEAPGAAASELDAGGVGFDEDAAGAVDAAGNGAGTDCFGCPTPGIASNASETRTQRKTFISVSLWPGRRLGEVLLHGEFKQVQA